MSPNLDEIDINEPRDVAQFPNDPGGQPKFPEGDSYHPCNHSDPRNSILASSKLTKDKSEIIRNFEEVPEFSSQVMNKNKYSDKAEISFSIESSSDSKVSKKLLGYNPMVCRRAFCTPACMSIGIWGSAQSNPMWTSQTNVVVPETKSVLAVTSLEPSCDPDRGELSSKELRPVECKDGIVSNDKKSTNLSDSDLDEDVLDEQQAVPMPNRVARAFKTQLRGPIRASNSQLTSSIAHMPCSIPRTVDSLR